MKRLGIFCFYEKDGIVDKYIEFLLDDIILNVEQLYIVCNGEVNDEGMQVFRKYTNKICLRENKGFDAGAYKDVLLNHISYDELSGYDELLLVNNSFFGPIYPFKNVFDKMASSDADFWGLINHGYNKYSRLAINTHIQSYFIVVRKEMLLSECFLEFWRDLNNIESFKDAIIKFEVGFTKYFTNAGFKSDVFVDIDAYEQKNDFAPIDWSLIRALDLVEKFNFPVIKKTTFTMSSAFNLNGKSLFSILAQNTSYDVNLIWDYLIRAQNTQTIYTGLSLHNVLPTSFQYIENNTKGKVGIFIHLYYYDLVQDCFSYIVNFPSWVDVFITTSSEKTYQLILEQSKSIDNIKKVTLVANKGRDIASLMVHHKKDILNYDLFCFTHDKKSLKNFVATMGDIFRLTLWENSIKNDGFIANIITVFEKNPKIGLLVPPYPRISSASIGYENWWGENYINTVNLAKKIGIDTKHISSNHSPLSIGTSFWARTCALRKLLEYPFSLDDFQDEPLPGDGTISHAVERIFPFVAQDAGYATGVVESTDFAEKRIVFLEQIAAKNLNFAYLREYVKKRNDCYIYGCGKIAGLVAGALMHENFKIKGFIVTDYNNNQKEFMERPVYSVDDVILSADTGVVLALNSQNTKEVVAQLDKRGITDYFKFLSVD